MTTMKKLQIHNLSKHYGPIKAIDNLSLEVLDGELLAVLGPSGCGKSTLLSCIAGILQPENGEIRLVGRSIFSSEKQTSLAPEERNIGFVFQHYALWPHMTVFQNIAYPLKMRRRPADYLRHEVARILKLLHLEGKAPRHPHELSGGEQQRVALGRALIMKPDLLLLDEPLSNLDARLREQMQEEITRLQRKLHLTVIHVTHDQSEAMAMADRIAVMNQGIILQVDRPATVYENPNTPFVADFVGTNNLLKGEYSGPFYRLRIGEKPETDILVPAPAVGMARPAGQVPLREGDAPNRPDIPAEKNELLFAVRPEDILIYRRGKCPGGNHIGYGVIKNHIYRGAHIVYEINTGHTTLRARLHPEDRFIPGEQVGFSFRRVVPLSG